MGKRKRRKTSKTRKKQKTISLDFLGGIFIAIGVILLVFYWFEDTSGFAAIFSEILAGMFGIVKYAIPTVLIITGIKCIVIEDKNFYPASELVKGVITVFMLSGVVYSFAHTRTLFTEGTASYFKWIWVGGITGVNLGGMMGGLIASCFVPMIGIVGTRVLLIATTFLLTLSFLGITLRQFAFTIYNMIATVIEWIVNIIKDVFEKDEEVEKKKEEKRKLKEEKQREKKLNIQGNDKYDSHIKEGLTEQLEFDLGRLDKEEIAKEQRDEFFKKQKEIKEDTSVKEVLQLDHTKHAEDEMYEFP
ncbi:MAG: hypothetical protein PHD20_05475, partial [Clostridia bacterium]|nr:hypothetical protein [Clostridia bacterium]